MDLEYNLIAHRGYFDINKGIPENSIKAFKKAIRYNYMIEFDVRKTKDDKLIVFHDDNLKRCCGINKNIDECTYEELSKLYLFNTSSKIPLFSDVLSIIDGKVPIIIETKGNNKYGILEELMEKELSSYKGEYAIQSFNPLSILWYKRKRPNIKRGLLESVNSRKKISIFRKIISFNWILKPDFYSLDTKLKDKKEPNKLYLGWTIKDELEYSKYKDKYNNLICENMNLYSNDKKETK